MGDEILELLIRRLDQIERLILEQNTVREWYTTEEFAGRVGKAEFTVREHCRLGRLNARKRRSGRGKHASWVLSHDELLRYQREGLLPHTRPTSQPPTQTPP